MPSLILRVAEILETRAGDEFQHARQRQDGEAFGIECVSGRLAVDDVILGIGVQVHLVRC